MSYFKWLQIHDDPSRERLIFGVIAAYPWFLFWGITLVIIASIIKLKQKGIPLRDFEISLVIVIPSGILGASIFGKIFLPGMIWYHVFFFWEPGMSFFGSLLSGCLVGFGWFYYRSKTTLISLWVYADCILPNLLLGQMLGRWGNFYNHEILGPVVNYEDLVWLPHFIRQKLFYFPNLTGFDLPDRWWTVLEKLSSIKATTGEYAGQTLETVLNYPLQYRQPLFLFESLGTGSLWVIVTFVIANLGRWFSKPKPWDLEPRSYPGWFNKHYKNLTIDEIPSKATLLPIVYQKDKKVSPQTGEELFKMNFKNAWRKAYYWADCDQAKLRDFEQQQFKQQQIKKTNQKKLQTLKIQSLQKRQQIKISTGFGWRRWQNLWKEINFYRHQKKQFPELTKSWKQFFKGHQVGRALETLHNPHHFFIIRCGVETSVYLIGYLMIRLGLETLRLPRELILPEQPILDYILLSLILVFGILMFFVAQFIAPYRYREVGWLYEKSY